MSTIVHEMNSPGRSLLSSGLGLVLTFLLAQEVHSAARPNSSHFGKQETASITGGQLESQVSTEAISIQGHQHSYLLFHPSASIESQPESSIIKSQPTKFPLVIVFHGSYAGDRAIMNYIQLNKLAEEEGFFVAYPQMRFLLQWNLPKTLENPDIEYVREMVEHLERTSPIDRSRIFATGYSTGADFLYLLALNSDLSRRIAAFAPVCSNLDRNWAEKCQHQNPVAMLLVNGTADRLNRWEGDGKRWMSVPDAFKFWANHNGSQVSDEQAIKCKNWNPTNKKDTEAILLHASKRVTVPEVAIMKIYGGGHTWPGAAPKKHWILRTLLGPTHQKDQANKIMWDFFERNPLRQSSHPQQQLGQSNPDAKSAAIQ